MLYYTLDTCASNPEDNYAYNQCILFARCKLSWKIRLLIFIDWFLFDGSVFQRALRIFSNAMSRNSCCKYNIARYRFANFFTCLYQQVFSWVINRFINRKAIDNEYDKKCCWQVLTILFSNFFYFSIKCLFRCFQLNCKQSIDLSSLKIRFCENMYLYRHDIQRYKASRFN